MIEKNNTKIKGKKINVESLITKAKPGDKILTTEEILKKFKRSDYTTIRVDRETIDLLNQVKSHSRQSYAEVLIDCMNKYAAIKGLRIKW